MMNSGLHPKEFFHEMWHTLLHGRPWQGGMVNRRQDGTEYVQDMTTPPVRAHDGDITHFISAGQGHEMALHFAQDSTSRGTEIAMPAGQFARSIAPDLDGLLTVINRNTENLLSRPGLSCEPTECSDRIVHAGEQAAALAGWLLAFRRRQAQQFREVDLNGLILKLRRHLQAILPQDIELRIALEPTLGSVSADESSLEEALIHLVVNARDTMPEGGRLTLETAGVRQHGRGEAEGAMQGYVLLRVTDSGIGMDTAAQNPIFEPFYTTKREAPAAGLGLSAVYDIVKQAGGWVSVYTEKGAGSSVEIFLPSSNLESR